MVWPVSAMKASSSVLGLRAFPSGPSGVPCGDDFPVIDDGDLVGDAVGLFHVVGGEEDGDFLFLAEASG